MSKAWCIVCQAENGNAGKVRYKLFPTNDWPLAISLCLSWGLTFISLWRITSFGRSRSSEQLVRLKADLHHWSLCSQLHRPLHNISTAKLKLITAQSAEEQTMRNHYKRGLEKRDNCHSYMLELQVTCYVESCVYLCSGRLSK